MPQGIGYGPELNAPANFQDQAQRAGLAQQRVLNRRSQLQQEIDPQQAAAMRTQALIQQMLATPQETLQQAADPGYVPPFLQDDRANRAGSYTPLRRDGGLSGFGLPFEGEPEEPFAAERTPEQVRQSQLEYEQLRPRGQGPGEYSYNQSVPDFVLPQGIDPFSEEAAILNRGRRSAMRATGIVNPPSPPDPFDVNAENAFRDYRNIENTDIPQPTRPRSHPFATGQQVSDELQGNIDRVRALRDSLRQR